RYERKEEHKLNLLLAEFGIALDAPDKWKELALSLARAHVPGFYSMRHRRGRRTWWTDARRVALYRQVCRKLDQGGHTLNEICEQIANNGRHRRKGRDNEQISGGTLAKVFQEEKRRQTRLEKNTRVITIPDHADGLLRGLFLYRIDLARFVEPIEIR